MVEVALYAVARVYWSVFEGALGPHRGTIRLALVALGVLTIVTGMVMCVSQHQLKRMLAFSTVTHAGAFLLGLGLLSPLGLAAAALWVAGHALVKGALFLGTGIVLARLHSVDELALHGRGRSLPAVGGAFLLAGLGLAGLPPFLGFSAPDLIGSSGARHGLAWLGGLAIAGSALTAGVVLRAGLRIFLGLGDTPPRRSPADRAAGEETSETRAQPRRTPMVMVLPLLALVALSVGLGASGRLAAPTLAGAVRLENRVAYSASVLGTRSIPAAAPAEGAAAATPADAAVGAGSAAAALLLALLMLYWRRLPRLARRALEAAGPVTRPLRVLQSGRAGDYVTWIVVGAAGLSLALAAAIR